MIYFLMFMFIRFYIPNLYSTVMLQYSYALFLRVEGLGVPTSHNNNSLADLSSGSLQNQIMPPVPKYKYPSGHQKQTQNSSSSLGDDNVGQEANVGEDNVTVGEEGNMGEDNVTVGEEGNVGEDNVTVGEGNMNVCEDNVNDTVDEDDVNPVPDIDIFDPRNWGGLSNDMIKELVTKGPKRDMDVKGPVDKFGRHFSNTMYTRILSNRETCDREWLVYSKKLDKLYCFCCKVFRTRHPKGGLDDEGYNDWRHASGRLKEHEVGLEHFKNMNEWFELRQRLKCKETIDKGAYEHFRKEKDYWKQVILRIITLVKFLAKYGLAFRGSNEKLYQKGNGNFLGLVEMLEEFDPIMKEHVRRVLNEECYVHFLSHNIQNELIQLLGDKVRTEIIKKVKQAKYYSIILDCTPDTSHQEQMSIIVRYVNFNSSSVTIEESFLGFLVVDDTTGLGLFEVTCKELESLDLDIGDMHGQGYDNGANMRGKNKGVQTRFLEKNPRAFYSACGCHSLNLVLWQILKDNVKGLTLKSLSTTRWESRIDSIKPIRTQLGDVNVVSKRLQAKDVVLDVAIDEVDKLIKFFKDYREVGFSKALDEAREIANELGVNAEFRQKRVIYRKKQFDESSSVEEVTFSPDEDFRVNYFLSIVDQAIFSLETRFKQYQKFEKIFGFLFPKKLKTLDKAKLKECCYRLEDALKYEGESDIDAKELCTELKLITTFLPRHIDNAFDVLDYIFQRSTTYPYAINAYKVLLTIPVTVASAERSFSKLKLLKTYLRSTMSQERLNGLATISIESEILDTMDYKELIESFASKKR
ncbi:zinc finger MYM-type protein 1-like [Helianthus annuus]|uniref:zinc finger MYM-type protein 1-like n=1 Tax=Helianthus annuus TaxID=4232 RepID=UPI000B8FB578|nr:zinc finger MYM-type protein 1-like [Helianthus annuus]